MANEHEVPTGVNSNPESLQPEKPEDSPLGVYAPFDFSSEPFADLTHEAQMKLMELDDISTKTDVAARRLEIEQCWEAIHFDRGYQHLLRGPQGGWVLPGQQSGYGATQQYELNSMYDTNVYGSKGDIIVAALSREVPKVEFFPDDPNYSPDVIAAEEADRFKQIWSRNSCLHQLLVDTARIFWNEDRALFYTRYVLDGQKFGFEDETAAPVVPQDYMEPPTLDPTGQEGLEEFLDQALSQVPDDLEAQLNVEGEEVADIKVNSTKKPRGREITTVFGKLDHKVPIAVDHISEMQFVQVFREYDVVIAKAMFPWIADKIHPGSDKVSESELDRIARENVRQAVLGAYVTGDSFARHVTVKYTWLRPSMFMDDKVEDHIRAELLEAFPDGCLLVKAGPEFAFARNENMDNHLVIGHPLSGKGQNRRSLGDALISIQKRINDWVDLLDDFFKRTVPKKWYNAEAFDMEALKKNPNMPGASGPFQIQPGLTQRDQYMFVEETPQPQAALGEFIKWFIENLSEQISGALPSLFGAATGEDTVGNAVIQRDQALQRVGSPWNVIQGMFARAAQQAVRCAAECREGRSFSQSVPVGDIASEVKTLTVNTANLTKGKVQCYPEANPAFPESWQQREAKVTQLVEMAVANPQLGEWLFTSDNLPLIADAIRMKQFKTPGAISVLKQKSEFELLLRSGPNENPKVLEATTALQGAQEGYQQAQAAALQGGQMPPEMAQAPQQIQQLQQAIQSLPQLISSVPIAEDESENHQIEASTCFEWLNGTEGQKFKYGTPQQKAAYENVHLHYQEHLAMAKKIAAANAPPGKPPSESISVPVDKMPVNVSVQALAKMGITASPKDFEEHQKNQLNDAIAKKTIPEAVKNKD